MDRKAITETLGALKDRAGGWRELGQVFGIDHASVYRWAKRGQIPRDKVKSFITEARRVGRRLKAEDFIA